MINTVKNTIIVCFKSVKSTVRRGDNVEDYRPDKTDKKGSRKRSNGKMCCIVFLRNAAVFLNYLIVLSAFIASILFIYVYLGEQDLDVINPSENFYILRGSVTIEMILAILVCKILIILNEKKYLGNLLRIPHACGNVLFAAAGARYFSFALQCTT